MACGYGSHQYDRVILFSDPGTAQRPPVRSPVPVRSAHPAQFSLCFDQDLQETFTSITGVSLPDFTELSTFLDHKAFLLLSPTRASVHRYVTGLIAEITAIVSAHSSLTVISANLAALAQERPTRIAATVQFQVQVDDLTTLDPARSAAMLNLATAGWKWFAESHNGLRLKAPHLVEQEWFPVLSLPSASDGRNQLEWFHRDDSAYDFERGERALAL